MTTLDALKTWQADTKYNLLCFSQNYSMRQPKNGCEKEWKRENEKLIIIQRLITQELEKIKKKNRDYER